MLIENRKGYIFSFDEYDELMLLTEKELLTVAGYFEPDDKYIKKLLVEKTISNYTGNYFEVEDFDKVYPVKVDRFKNFVNDCDFMRGIVHYSPENMVKNFIEDNPYKLEDFAYKTISLTTIKNEFVDESFTVSKYQGILEELPLTHPAYKLLDDIKKNPFFADEAYKKNIQLVADGETWYVQLEYSDPNRNGDKALVCEEDTKYYLDKYKGIDYLNDKGKKINKSVFKIEGVRTPQEALNKHKEKVSNKEKNTEKGLESKNEDAAEQEGSISEIKEEKENEKEEKKDDFGFDL
jgi:hypothetical protein